MSESNAPHLPESKDAFSFNEETREYLGVVRVFLSPIEQVYYLPNNVVEVEPPKNLGRNQAARLNDAGDAWEVVNDYRRVMLYDTSTARPVPNSLQLGDLPAKGVTAAAPAQYSDHMPLRSVWDPGAGVWREEPDYSRHALYEKATGANAPSLEPGAPLPDTLTTQAPPLAVEHQAPQWSDASGAWELVPDYRGVTYWTADGQKHEISALGELLPYDALMSEPEADVDQAGGAEAISE